MPSPACSTTRLFHYFLHGQPDPVRLRAEGLVARVVPRGGDEDVLQRTVYAELFEPRLRTPFTHPGVFFTPIDFRALPGTPLSERPRVTLDVGRLAAGSSVLTWQLDDRRVRLALSAESLEAAASVWTAERVREWFGRDRHRLFWYVPQVGCFQSTPVRLDPGVDVD